MPGDGNHTSGPTPSGPAAGPGDELLAARAREGDEGAFETLVHRHGPALLKLAARILGDTAEAEDAVQEAFVSAWRRLPEYRGEAAFRTWMYRIVTNRCLNQLRSRRPAADLDAVPEPAAPEHEASPARAAESTAAMKALGTALAELSPEQRACWVLRELHNQSYEEIAEAVGITHQAVRGRIFRARRHLTEAMGAWR
ncbi:RNA polymerase sigma factor [Streptomyces physcomitrii]|uniref:RNA polymerase ECF-subfamily sigma factor n=1 Tax=Streptomyces albus (strain ATCC 21838 / DSM 41398 / FERM P-419 / JCM 4703 / NBRC 107858) TaxID=1081613 RepID=A0A0B5F9X1_STRA4|nr:RNA polymerase ECF-subfamily sigma factor [Streptomyces albus]AOU81956.1 RNA polymerase ECF-subfamily sigma factor [Streptomyces albus]AYN37641.1 RNA polymerase subunit sigma-70 [Streptomyces albus]